MSRSMMRRRCWLDGRAFEGGIFLWRAGEDVEPIPQLEGLEAFEGYK
jgi:hypothetical protein